MSRFSSILEQNDVAQVFDLFETYQKNSIYVVGGSIRDALLNREITDIDFATSLKPKTITEILNKENIKFIKSKRINISSSKLRKNYLKYK